MKVNLAHARAIALVALASGSLALTACSAGSIGGGDSEGAGNSITFLTNNSPDNIKIAEALIAAFEEKSDVQVELDTYPTGGEGDNLIKTRLSTGDMAEVFQYNSGSLFQGLSPVQNLVPLTDEEWVSTLDESFIPSVSADENVYGAPYGSSIGGGILYNIPVYEQLGLAVPKTWEEFEANNAKIKAAGITPVEATFADTWTSQILVLGDYHNVETANPGWAEQYTAGEVKYSTTPEALAGFQHLQDLQERGDFNGDFASASYEDGLTALLNGEAAHYPMLTFALPAMDGIAPDKVNDIGFFALPGASAADNGMTLWLPGGVYIPTTAEGEKLTAAQEFVAFMASPEACAATAEVAPVGGPFLVEGCELGDDVATVVKDVTAYVDAGTVTPALEFLSPIKGPALEQITVEVGSGLRSAADGAALYDQDVEKQAKQLGLPGW
jgi:raffinose/stachyose/melibiose transport system substrate-binding protein